MRKERGIYAVLAALLIVAQLLAQFERPRPQAVRPGIGVERFRNSWQVLEPITRGNLSIYPVVSGLKADTSELLTLEEGLASGAVRIAERNELQGALRRRRPEQEWPRPTEPSFDAGARVNELVLVNNSSKSLILLAGEVVSGGKQNRIIGVDAVVPPHSEPVPLTVFCVEHGRWSEGGGGFGSAKAMAHPGIRKEAQANRSQEGVWNSVAGSVAKMEAAAPTQSYLDALASPKAKRAEGLAGSIQADYERELQGKLQGRHAVGVIVAVNGEFIWSDIFPSEDLFLKYWPKLLRSYVLEADSGTRSEAKNGPSAKQALAYLLADVGRVSIKTELGAYRRTEISAEAYKIVALEALAKAETGGLLAHYNKMSLT
jgi:hypothetical protein